MGKKRAKGSEDRRAMRTVTETLPIVVAGQGKGGSPVDLRPLKASIQRLRADHPLRELIMAEPDQMPRVEYAAKAEVWCRVLGRS